MKLHKSTSDKVDKYVGFGSIQQVHAPLCDGAQGLWAGKSYFLKRNWKDVTCKKCLKKRPV